MIPTAIAILTWRDEASTRACLTSLRRAIGWTGPIVVIDNGSGTGEGVRLAAEFEADVVSLETNGGVPAGYNAALRWAFDRNVSAVILANNDVTFADPSLPIALADLLQPGIAAAGPVVRGTDGSIASAGVRVHRWLGHAQRLREPVASTPYAVDAIDGSCWAISVPAACRVAGLSEDFFLYWEETDWCARARAAGLHVLVDPSVAVVHAGGGSGNLRQTRRYALRNSLLYLRRNSRGPATLTSAVAWLFGRIPLFIVRRLSERADPRGVAADVAWAIAFHVRDIWQRGWHRRPDGPKLCG